MEWEDKIFMKAYKKRIFFFTFILFGIALFFFYLKYVPLVSPFQIILIPILIIIFVLSAVRLKIGILLFVFAFPLINALPYFFSIYEQTPHAPTALVLFLFFFWGWLLNNAINENSAHYDKKILKPIVLFSILVVISALLTSWKYTNFFPVMDNNIYELITNVKGVSAGGAIMSSIFFSLNYLTGFAFLIILTSTGGFDRFYIKKILIILLISTSIALALGFYQHLVNIEFGNTPFRIKQSLINASFKDPLSLGGYLGAFIPFVFALGIAFKGFLRFFSLILFACSFFLILHSGSKSGFISAVISLVLFIITIMIFNFPLKKATRIKTLKLKFITSSILIFAFLFILGFLAFQNRDIIKNSKGYKRINQFVSIYKKGGLTKALGIRWTNRWYLAGRMAQEYPLTGVGMGAFIIELPNYERKYNIRKRPTDSAENYFFHVLSELGIIGLIISLWIFFEIFKLVFRRLKDPEIDDKWKIIQIGIACGIFSIFLQYFVHTYIGSYEIKYTFWLLVGLMIIIGRREKGGEKEIKFSKKYKLIGTLVLLIFTSIHLWNSTHSLSLARRTREFGIKQDFGFYQLEKTADGHEFRWTRGYGGTTIKVEKPVIEIPLLASHPDIQQKPVKVKIYIVKNFFKEKKLLDEIILNRSIWNEYQYHIPEEVGEEIILLFKVNRTWIPLKVHGTPDPRKLGVAVGKIRFRDFQKERLPTI